jgi:hypothetical protein
MRRLFVMGQDWSGIQRMNNSYSHEMNEHSTALVTQETIPGADSDQLEVNVIFTDEETTAGALKSAESLAKGLGACIRLRAAIVVPFRLSLDQPPVSVRFMEQRLCKLVDQWEQEGPDPSIHLYVCRDRIEAMLLVLRPNSLVVIGDRKRWWPTAMSRMAGILRAKGHRVVVVDVKRKTTRRLP